MNAVATPETKQNVSIDASAAITYGRQAQRMLADATGLIIDSPDMLELVAEDLRKVKTLQKDVEASRTTITGPLNQALRAVNDLFRAPAEYLTKAETVLKGAIGTYQAEQKRLADIAAREAQARENARRAELAKQEAEAAEKARALRAEAEKATQAGNVEELTRLAEQAEDIQAHADAASAMAAVVSYAPAVAAPSKVSGISGRTVYSVDSVDLMVLVKAVAEGKAPLEAIQANATFLGAQARAFKKAGDLYPGVVVKAATSVSARSL